ncbi:zinc finger protein 862-like [Strongylocentrotus purpuratus]|uniref:DUF4371 domain-containing protein n=1 Tax=Strongylocentrotus purpuratus TaxID=7668 RepID=A0A7M7NJD9_STRPU|nr:zinc finger protein 862-like [Strongylocentrotus purpuratus]
MMIQGSNPNARTLPGSDMKVLVMWFRKSGVFFVEESSRSFANSTRQLELRKMLTPMLTELLISRRRICEHHAQSKGHENAKAACIAEDTAPAERPLERLVLRMHRNVFDWLVRLFQIAYFIAKEEQPFTNMSKLVGLEKLHCVDLGNAYANDQACQKFTRYNAQILREPLQKHLRSGLKPPHPRESPSSTYCYHSLFTDRITDRSDAEREVVYVKIFQNGEAHMKMMGLIDVDHATATAVKEALVKHYKEFLGLGEDEVDFATTGCIGAGTDGAAINFGVHRGMMAQLRNEMPWLIAVHCVAHRLELAVKDAFKNSFFSNQAGAASCIGNYLKK